MAKELKKNNALFNIPNVWHCLDPTTMKQHEVRPNNPNANNKCTNFKISMDIITSRQKQIKATTQHQQNANTKLLPQMQNDDAH